MAEICDYRIVNSAIIMDSDTTHPIISVKKLQPKSNISLLHELQPIFNMMSVFELYHTPKRWIKSSESNWYLFVRHLHKYYCVFMQLLLWFNVVRTIAGIWIGNEVNAQWTSMRLTAAAWLLVCAISSSIWYYICNTNQLPNLVDFWQRYCQSSKDSNTLGISLDVHWLRRRVQLLLCLCIGFIIFNCSVITISMYAPIESVRNKTFFYDDSFKEIGLAMHIPILILTGIVDTASFLIPIAVFVLFCMISCKQFDLLSKKFVSALTEEGELKQDLTRLRRQHLYLSKSVFLADKMFSLYLAVTTSIYIYLFYICFGLFRLVISEVPISTFSTILISMWLILMCATFGVITVSAAHVNDKVLIFTMNFI